MSSSADLRDILGGEENAVTEKRPSTPTVKGVAVVLQREGLLDDKKKSNKQVVPTAKRPEGVPRELWSLMPSGDAPIIQTDTSAGYKSVKAKLGGLRKVHAWRWTEFTNPGRTDGAVFRHWRRETDDGEEYPFARFNKLVSIPSYSDEEYQLHLHEEGWTRRETDHLFDLCGRFDLRFAIVLDRYEPSPRRSMEDLKERYYSVCRKLSALRGEPEDEFIYDAEHERKRKLQLDKLWHRTPEEVEEEEQLVEQLRKIEMRKKERERKAQDLQKLITAADINSDPKKALLKKRKSQSGQPISGEQVKQSEPSGIRFPEFRQPGPILRSQKMKLPSNITTKKMKALETMLGERGLEGNPVPTEPVCVVFNNLRCHMVLLHELKQAHSTMEYELETLKHRLAALTGEPVAGEQQGGTPKSPVPQSGLDTQRTGSLGAVDTSEPVASTSKPTTSPIDSTQTPADTMQNLAVSTENSTGTTHAPLDSTQTPADSSQSSSDVIQTPNLELSVTSSPLRKRRAAAIEQVNLMKKIRKGSS